MRPKIIMERKFGKEIPFIARMKEGKSEGEREMKTSKQMDTKSIIQ